MRSTYYGEKQIQNKKIENGSNLKRIFHFLRPNKLIGSSVEFQKNEFDVDMSKYEMKGIIKSNKITYKFIFNNSNSVNIVYKMKHLNQANSFNLLIGQQNRRQRRFLFQMIDQVKLPGATFSLPNAETKCRGRKYLKNENKILF
jgi:hypothetical protein